MSLDPRYISDYLEAIARHAKGEDPEFSDHVRERLAMGEREYNGESLTKPLTALLTEVREEEADVPAWLLIVIQRTFTAEAEGTIDDKQGQHLRVRCIEWAVRSRALWREMTDELAAIR